MTNRMIKRKVFYIQLKLISPLSVSSGEDEWTDSDVLRDGTGRPFVAGSSLAGAMRAYLQKEKHESCLMGYTGAHGDGKMSSLFVSDLNFRKYEFTSVRDGVALNDGKTAITGSKYEIEIIEAGAKGQFFMELTVREQDDEQKMDSEIASIFRGIQKGEIRLGCKKTRGFGEFRLTFVNCKTYTSENYLEYCQAYDRETDKNTDNELDVWLAKVSEKAKMVHIEVPLKMKGGISIRQYAAKKNEPDFVQLTDHGKPVIPGSSFAGAIRHRIKEILERLAENGTELPYNVQKIIDISFGYVDGVKACASNIIISEAEIKGARPLTMMRTGVSRFESAVKDGALYKEKTYVDGELVLRLAIRKGVMPEDEKWILGILLLALKDLQNGFLAVGGQTAIGRGLFENNGAILIDGQEGLENQMIQESLKNMRVSGGKKA